MGVRADGLFPAITVFCWISVGSNATVLGADHFTLVWVIEMIADKMTGSSNEGIEIDWEDIPRDCRI